MSQMEMISGDSSPKAMFLNPDGPSHINPSKYGHSEDGHTEETVSARFLRRWREQPPGIGSAEYLAVSAVLAGIFVLVSRLGPGLDSVRLGVAPGLASGVALAAFLLLEHRIGPAIFLGTLWLYWNLGITSSAGSPVILALGSTGEGLLAAYLVERFAGGVGGFRHAQSILRFALLAAILCTALGAALRIATLFLEGPASLGAFSHFGPTWGMWWLGGAAGDLLVTPFLVLWLTTPPPRWDRRKLTEATALGLYLLLVAMVVFGNLVPAVANNYPLEFVCIPFLIWAALRFSQAETAVAGMMLAAISIWGTLSGYGPFVRLAPNESLLLLEAFLCVAGLMAHVVAAVVAERHQAETALRQIHDELAERAVSDPLTGLANYRRFVDVFEAEADRSRRTGRPFALVLFDLDDLKKLNDANGHLVGTRALCRVGNTMRVYCRGIDTAVRYGGDEFALLLPETKVDGAQQVARRICVQVAGDGEAPPISVSFGIAVYPEDGRNIEEVFGKADAALYLMKGRRPLPQEKHDESK